MASAAWLLAGIPSLHGSPVAGEPGNAALTESVGAPEVVIDPASWWTETGTNTTFVATWAGDPPGCSLSPSWFRWAVAPGGSEGTLSPSNNSEAVFSASAGAGGTSTVEVRSAATLDCDGNLTSSFSGASARLTVAGALHLTGVAFTTDPVAPGQVATLTGIITGGEPPYALRITWGDGSSSLENVSAPGNFSAPHAFHGTGLFTPELLATDAAGRSAGAAPAEPLNVSAGFAAAIAASSVVTDEGVPVTFTVRTEDAPANFSWLFACPSAEPATPNGSAGPSFGCVFEHDGTATVTFEAVGASAPYPVATASIDERVVAPPALTFPVLAPLAEVGPTAYAAVDLLNGTPPFDVSWSLVGSGNRGNQAVPQDGLDYLPLNSSVAGALELSVVVVDGLGVASAPASEVVRFVPALLASAAATAVPGDAEVTLNVTATVLAGAPPFSWTVVPGFPTKNATNASGTLAGAGAFTWNATYRREGSLEITVVLVDSDGASSVSNLSVVLAPPLQVTTTVDGVDPGAVRLRVRITGGLPPYQLRWNDSAGESGNGSASAPGTVVLEAATDAAGNCSFTVVVDDRLGVSASSTSDVDVPVSGAGSPPDDLGAVVLVGGLVLGAGGAGALLLRRRRSTTDVPTPDPVTVLREVIEASDGVDRGLVEMLAEERGVPIEVVRTTLERLKDEGSVRSGRGADGEEVLAWR